MPSSLASPAPARALITPPATITAVEPRPARLVASPDPLVGAALGRFAGKLAHELNNALTAISSFGEMLLEGVPPDSPAREDALEILAATRRAVALSSALHALARPAAGEVGNLELGAWAAEVAPRLDAVLGDDRALAVDAPGEPLVIAVDRGRLEAALDALVTNAREATTPGGRCILRVERVSVRDRDPEYPASLGSGRYARVTIVDDGCGMDAGVLATAAEPLAGTRRGARRGLGLALVEQFARTAGGALQLRSAAGSGTSAALYLPVVAARGTASN